MIKLCLTLLLFIGHLASVYGQSGTGIGLQINQYQKDFGMGVHVTSPYLANEKLAIRLRGNAMFYEHVKNNETTWSPYANVSLGLVGISGRIENFIRLYGEGGFTGLFPSHHFSSENFVFGGYGVFGFEFIVNEKNLYFIEIGGIGTGANADKLENDPIYSNGLLISVGFRVHP